MPMVRTVGEVLIPFNQIGPMEPHYSKGRGLACDYIGETVDGKEPVRFHDATRENTMLALVACDGWEALLLTDDDAGRPEGFAIEPVMALGLNCRGQPVPVTAEIVLSGSPSDNEHVLRHVASGRIYAVSDGFDSAAAWLADRQRSHDADRKRRAEPPSGRAEGRL
jgi:hypothetical protein